MRISYTIDNLRSYYSKTVKRAGYYLSKKQFDKSARCIRAAAILQYNLNDIFVDFRVNTFLNEMSKALFPISTFKEDFDKECVFLVDFFGIDNRGLTQQYLDAIIHNYKNQRIVYIHESCLPQRSINIRHFLENNGIELIELGQGRDVEKAIVLYEIVNKFRPAKAFFHLHPAKSIAPILSFYAFPQITKYQINITDHAFWLGGSDFFDYTIEFRKYGAFISERKRGFNKHQIKLLPYYPWQEMGQFAGFPIETKERIVLFSGGSLYKIEGDGNIFLDMAKAITEFDDRVVFFMAGGGDSRYFDGYVLKNKLQDKFFYIGDRHDINDVLSRIDIYLGTYPLGGGLMTQLAAINSKPILMYKGFDNSELFINKEKIDFMYNTIDDLMTEAKKLVKDSDYRIKRGKRTKELIITQDKFRNIFTAIVNDKTVEEEDDDDIIEMSYIYSTYLKRINDGYLSVYLECLLLDASRQFLGIKPVLNLLLNLRGVKALIKRTNYML